MSLLVDGAKKYHFWFCHCLPISWTELWYISVDELRCLAEIVAATLDPNKQYLNNLKDLNTFRDLRIIRSNSPITNQSLLA